MQRELILNTNKFCVDSEKTRVKVFSVNTFQNPGISPPGYEPPALSSPGHNSPAISPPGYNPP